MGIASRTKANFQCVLSPIFSDEEYPQVFFAKLAYIYVVVLAFLKGGWPGFCGRIAHELEYCVCIFISLFLAHRSQN